MRFFGFEMRRGGMRILSQQVTYLCGSRCMWPACRICVCERPPGRDGGRRLRTITRTRGPEGQGGEGRGRDYKLKLLLSSPPHLASTVATRVRLSTTYQTDHLPPKSQSAPSHRAAGSSLVRTQPWPDRPRVHLGVGAWATSQVKSRRTDVPRTVWRVLPRMNAYTPRPGLSCLSTTKRLNFM